MQINFQEFVDEYMSANKDIFARRTMQIRQVAFDKFKKFCNGDEVNTETLMRFQADMLASGSMKSNVNLQMRSLLSLFNWHKEVGKDFKHPLPSKLMVVGDPPERIPITQRDYEKLLAVIPHMPTKYQCWDYAIRLAWYTGMRMSDVCLLKVRNVDMQTRIIRLSPKKTQKTGREIEVPVPGDVIVAMQRLIMAEDQLFVCPRLADQSMRQPSGTFLSAEFKRIARRAKLKPGKSFHSLRHGFVTRLLARNVNATVIADMLGVSLERVMTYAHTSMEQKKRALGIKD